MITSDVHWAAGLTAFGTVGAVIVALFLAGLEGRRRIREMAADQASRVSACAEVQDPFHHGIFVQNDSGAPIYRFRIRAEWYSHQPSCDPRRMPCPWNYIGYISSQVASGRMRLSPMPRRCSGCGPTMGMWYRAVMTRSTLAARNGTC